MTGHHYPPKRRKIFLKEATRERVAEAVTCPDCNSMVTVVEDPLKVFTACVQHDETCPYYRSL